MMGKKLMLREICLTVLESSFPQGYGSVVIPYCLSRSAPLSDSPFALVSGLTSQPPSQSTEGQQSQYISASEATRSCWSLSLCSDPALTMSNEDK